MVAFQLEANDWGISPIVLLNFNSRMEFQESWFGWWDAGGEMTDCVIFALSKRHYEVTCLGTDLTAESSFHP